VGGKLGKREKNQCEKSIPVKLGCRHWTKQKMSKEREGSPEIGMADGITKSTGKIILWLESVDSSGGPKSPKKDKNQGGGV